MPQLNINGHTVRVDDSFLKLSPDEQNATVDEIASSLPNKINVGQEAQGDGVAKAGLAGFGRGAASIPGFFGDVQQIAKSVPFAPKRSMLDAILEKAGVDHIPNSQDMINKAAEYVPDIKYQPKNTAEKYAATIGSFIPGAMMAGGGAVRNAVQYGAIPGAASEFLGQATDGTSAEPYARALGGVAGGMVGPSVANIPGRIVSPIAQRPSIARQVAAVESEGIPLTAGQRTGNKALQWIESTAMDQPLAARNAEDFGREQGAAINKAMTKRMGYEADLLEPSVWQAARTRLNKNYEDLAQRNTLSMDKQFGNDLANVDNLYESSVNESQRIPAISNFINDLVNNISSGGSMSGSTYQAMRSRLDKLSRAVRVSDPAAGEAYKGLRIALDNAMERSISNPDDLKLWKRTNKEWGALKTLQKAGTRAGAETAEGYLSPSSVRNTVSQRDPVSYLEGNTDLGELAKNIEAVKPRLPQSGTQPRTQAQKILNLGLGGAGSTIGGLVAGIPGAVAGGLAGASIPTAMGRAVMSKPVQAWLGNQKASKIGLLRHPTAAQKRRGLLADLIAAQVEGQQ